MGLTLSEQLDVVSAFSSAISAVATAGTLAAAWWIYKGTVHAGSKPVLIFSMKVGSRWQLQNVGNGPAIEIVVYDIHSDGSVETATRCHPLAAGANVELSWLVTAAKLIVTYTDTHGNRFTTTCSNSVQTIEKDDKAPKVAYVSHQWLQEVLVDRGESQLKDSDLAGKSWQELDILRNEIFARHGHPFLKRPDLRRYFDSKPWYEPQDTTYDAILPKLSKEERFNAYFILYYQSKTGIKRPRDAVIEMPQPNELPTNEVPVKE